MKSFQIMAIVLSIMFSDGSKEYNNIEAMLFTSNLRFFGYLKVQVVRVFLISMQGTRKC